MRLELGFIPIHDVQFADTSRVEDGVLYVNAEDIKALVEGMGLQAWFSAIRHRDDERVSPNGVPAPCHEIDDLFDTVILLIPQADACVELQFINNSSEQAVGGKGLRLDPTTMMVKER